jgi:hypothetical protein
MEGKSGREAGRDGNESAPSPVGDNAKGQQHEAGQQRDFERNRNHGIPSFRSIPAGYPVIT